MRLVITGATGNLGTALLRRLADRPDIDVVGIVRRPPPPEPPYDRVDWRAMDLTDDAHAPRLDAALRGADAVVHLVWGFQPTRDIAYLHRLGPGTTARVLRAADRAGVTHLVHTSSVGTYAPRTGTTPVDEDYPHTGAGTSAYSVHKAEAEAQLDDYERTHRDGMLITRMRPGFVLQASAGAELSRYALPAYLPARLLRALPVLPLDRDFAAPVVHADDLADAYVRTLDRRVGGAFNLAADEPMTRADIAAVLDAHPIHLPARVLHVAMAASWRLHLQPLSPGWLDLAFAVPLMSSARAHRELDWHPRVGAREALAETVAGIAGNDATASAVLRPRAALERLRTAALHGTVSSRHRP